MQDPTSVSLNALRTFLVVSKHMSIKKAADELRVTPGAVSHQVRSFEHSLGTQLLVRRNNAIELTDIGNQLAQQSAPGMSLLHSAIATAVRNTQVLRVRSPMSFAARWLIPKLHLFKAQNPSAHVEVETYFDSAHRPSGDADVTIRYYRGKEAPEGVNSLFRDACRPYLSPSLLSEMADPSNVKAVPALQCAADNWDWKLWLAETGQPEVKLNYTERFDLDDTALRAASAGMGMTLASDFMVEAEVSDGRLVPLPGGEEVCLGNYGLQIGRYETHLSRKFVRWIEDTSKSRPST